MAIRDNLTEEDQKNQKKGDERSNVGSKEGSSNQPQRGGNPQQPMEPGKKGGESSHGDTSGGHNQQSGPKNR